MCVLIRGGNQIKFCTHFIKGNQIYFCTFQECKQNQVWHTFRSGNWNKFCTLFRGWKLAQVLYTFWEWKLNQVWHTFGGGSQIQFCALSRDGNWINYSTYYISIFSQSHIFSLSLLVSIYPLFGLKNRSYCYQLLIT